MTEGKNTMSFGVSGSVGRSQIDTGSRFPMPGSILSICSAKLRRLKRR